MSDEVNLPKCDKRIEMAGGRANVCLGNEPYSCERMLRDSRCPLGKTVEQEQLGTEDVTFRKVDPSVFLGSIDKPCPCCGEYPIDSESTTTSTSDFGFGIYCKKCIEKIHKVNEICRGGAKEHRSSEMEPEEWGLFNKCIECKGQLFTRSVTGGMLVGSLTEIKICPNCDIGYLPKQKG